MLKKLIDKISIDDYVGCFGDFNIMDPVCKKFCALSLSCAIDRDQNDKLELLEDLLVGDTLITKIQ